MHHLLIALAFGLPLVFAGPALAGEGCQHSDKSAVQANAPAPQQPDSARVEAEKAPESCGQAGSCEAERGGDQKLASRDGAND